MTNTLTVIYRTGGTENFQWHQVGKLYNSRLLACDKADELVRMGYSARVHDADKIKAIGLPETFEYGIGRDPEKGMNMTIEQELLAAGYKHERMPNSTNTGRHRIIEILTGKLIGEFLAHQAIEWLKSRRS